MINKDYLKNHQGTNDLNIVCAHLGLLAVVELVLWVADDGDS